MSKNKFQLGDKVKVKDSLIVGERYGGVDYYETMSECRGRVLTIDGILKLRDASFVYRVHSPGFFFSEEMLEYIEDNKESAICEEVKEEDLESYNPIKPAHYNVGNFDVIAFCIEHNLGFGRGNIIKYVTRAGKKDKSKEIEDLEKAMEFLRREIKHLRGDK